MRKCESDCFAPWGDVDVQSECNLRNLIRVPSLDEETCSEELKRQHDFQRETDQ